MISFVMGLFCYPMNLIANKKNESNVLEPVYSFPLYKQWMFELDNLESTKIKYRDPFPARMEINLN